jgi:phage baseplate assembly protein gpV
MAGVIIQSIQRQSVGKCAPSITRTEREKTYKCPDVDEEKDMLCSNQKKVTVSIEKGAEKNTT